VRGGAVEGGVVDVFAEVAIDRGRVVEHRHAVDEPEEPNLQVVVGRRPLAGLFRPVVGRDHRRPGRERRGEQVQRGHGGVVDREGAEGGGAGGAGGFWFKEEDAQRGVFLREVEFTHGIGGAAVMVDCVTNNKVRTVADVRHAFAKNGGNMGTDGSVAFQFKHCGQFVFAPGTSEEKVMEIGLDAGAEDVATNEDGSVELICPPPEFTAVKTALEAAGLKAEFAEVTMKPLSETVLTGDDGAKMQRLLDALEALDDVQEVYTTALVED
jgi:hypothetical protein